MVRVHYRPPPFLGTNQPSGKGSEGFFYGPWMQFWMQFEGNRVWLSWDSRHPDGCWSAFALVVVRFSV
jgi:hypothetical protein